MAGHNHGGDLALRKTIGVRMRRARRNSKLTIKAVGQKLGISSTSVTCWEAAEEFQRELLLPGARGMDRRQRRALVQEILVEDLH